MRLEIVRKLGSNQQVAPVRLCELDGQVERAIDYHLSVLVQRLAFGLHTALILQCCDARAKIRDVSISNTSNCFLKGKHHNATCLT